MNLRVTYDRQANAVYIYLREIGPAEAKGTPITSNIIVDHDAGGRLIGIEVLGARETLPPELLAVAEDITGNHSAG